MQSDIRQQRIEDIRRRWQLTTPTGVVVRPMEAAVRALGNIGYDVRAAEALLPEGQRLYESGDWDRLLVVIARIHHALRTARPIPLPGVERPRTLSEIRAVLPPSPALPAVDWHDYPRRVFGGWLGKIIGNALGAPVEGWTAAQIRDRYGDVANYLTPPSSCNDDTSFPLVLLHTLDTYGPSFTSEQLALTWLERLPVAYTAEAIALENIRRGIFPPDSAVVDNPFRHWVGAMMKAEIAGWLAPGRPDIAIELAYRDAVIAHTTEGVYGALFVAAMTAAAFVVSDPRQLIDIGRCFVPPRSQFAQIVRQTLDWCRTLPDWTHVADRIASELGHRYHWIHVFPNAAIVMTALWFGAGDFTRSICIATMCGGDTDTTAGIVGAIIGTMRGVDAIPAKWRMPLGDRLESFVIGYTCVDIGDIVQRTVTWGKRCSTSTEGVS